MKMKIKYLFSAIALIAVSVSCNKWLEVEPRKMQRSEALYSTEKGFQKGLIGCYILLADAYIEHNTQTLEFMAQHWMTESESLGALRDLDFENSSAQNYVAHIHKDLYNIIAQCNDFLAYIDDEDVEFVAPSNRKMMKGEALAMRALCHFDILRLFGELPDVVNDPEKVEKTMTVRLPYSEKFEIKNPEYYGYKEFVEKILKDFKEAEALLYESDPAVKYTLEDLILGRDLISNGFVTEFATGRNVKFNYWAVKAFMARVYLYTGDYAKAEEYALSVINAEIDGEKIVDFNLQDLESGYYTTPTETLMAINVDNIKTDIPQFTVSGFDMFTPTLSRAEMEEKVFGGRSSNRFTFLWADFESEDIYDGDNCLVIKKYRQSVDDTANREHYFTKLRVAPMIRLSEMYLIAMEATSNLGEANRLMKIYMEDRGVFIDDFTSKTELDNEVFLEYRRELFAEGQMFYTYKRLQKKEMLWREGKGGEMLEVEEKNYVVPLPNTESENLK